MDYTHLIDIAEIAVIPDEGIFTRTIYNNKQVKVVVYSFADGEEIDEHSLAVPLELQIIHGDAVITLDGKTLEASAGASFHLPRGFLHSIYAKTPLVVMMSMHYQ